jgi:ribosomal protein S15P/S13E
MTEKSKIITEKDFKKKVLDLYKKGLTSEKIGIELEKEGINSKDYNTKISRILKEENCFESPDLINITNKLEKLENHIKKNKQDKRAKRERVRIFSQLRKIKKYLKIEVR